MSAPEDEGAFRADRPENDDRHDDLLREGTPPGRRRDDDDPDRRPRQREEDDYDDRPRRRRDYDDDYDIRRRGAADIGQDAGIRMLLPVGRSGWAIASGYLGLISLLCLPAPFALFTGIMAIREIRADSKKHGMGRAIFGIIMGTLGTLPLIAILASLIMRLLLRPR